VPDATLFVSVATRIFLFIPF